MHSVRAMQQHHTACPSVHSSTSLTRRALCTTRTCRTFSSRSLNRSPSAAALSNVPSALKSLDLHAAESSAIEGLGVLPYSWGVPPGRLYSQGIHVCDLPALQHLGISFEAGPIELGRDHHSSVLLSTLLSKLERHHVGLWLFEAAARPEASYLFECHPGLKAWLQQLAEHKHGKAGFLLVQHNSPSAQEAACWLQTLSSSFGRELHTIPVAFSHNTAGDAAQLLFSWLHELPGLSDKAEVDQRFDQTFDHRSNKEFDQFDQADLVAGRAQAHLSPQAHNTLGVLYRVAALLPGKPALTVKQLPSVGSKAFVARVQSAVPAAAALAAVAAAPSHEAAEAAAAAGYVDGRACIYVGAGLLERDAAAAAMHVVLAARDGLQLSSRLCAAAIEAAAAAATVAAAAAPVRVPVLPLAASAGSEHAVAAVEGVIASHTVPVQAVAGGEHMYVKEPAAADAEMPQLVVLAM